MASATAPAARGTQGGCLKCGGKGHWARDCTAPKSQWLPRNAPPGSQAGGTQQPTTGAEGNEENVIKCVWPVTDTPTSQQARSLSTDLLFHFLLFAVW